MRKLISNILYYLKNMKKSKKITNWQKEIEDELN